MARRKSADVSTRVIVVFGVLLAIGMAAVGGYYLKDRFIDLPAARAAGVARWPAARALVAARLKQTDALEFGEVWATHAGLICGMVNGRGSFSGLTGMTPFYVEGGRAVFDLDESTLEFSGLWQTCARDNWAVIVPGSPQAGFCATKAGAIWCKTYGN